MRRRLAQQDDGTSLKRKTAVSNGKAVCGAGFRRKGGIGGKTQSKVLPQRLRLSFESVVDFVDTLTGMYLLHSCFIPEKNDDVFGNTNIHKKGRLAL